jgi:hypothetical protein
MTDLEAAQAAMRSKMERRRHSKTKTQPEPSIRTASAELRMFITQEIRTALRLNRKKHLAHQAYLKYKAKNKKLTREVKAELRAMLKVWREMNRAMRECRDALAGHLQTYDRKSKQFALGFELGKEWAAIKVKEKGTQ